MIVRYFLSLAVAAWYVFLFTNRNLGEVIDLKKEYRRLCAQLETEKEEGRKLKLELQRASDDEYIQALIRKNLNKSKKGEIVFNLEKN